MKGKNMGNEIKQRISLLLKNSWSYKDIMDYMTAIGNKVGQSKAIELKETAAANGGMLLYKYGHVSVDSVLALLGTSKVKELSYLSMIDSSLNQGEKHEN